MYNKYKIQVTEHKLGGGSLWGTTTELGELGWGGVLKGVSPYALNTTSCHLCGKHRASATCSQSQY